MNWAAELASFHRAHGAPVLRASFKKQPEDFIVDEVLGFEPDGTGEHELVQIEKKGLSTPDVQLQLAKAYRLPVRNVNYAGLKDKQAITRQWFSVHAGIKRDEPDFSHMNAGISVLKRARNRRKLQRGSHRGNRFVITLRDCDSTSEKSGIATRLLNISLQGVPNYFGMQRFGHHAGNLAEVAEWFAGNASAPTSRTKRSLLLSSARSLIFNAVLSERVRCGTWNLAMTGEVVALNGSGSTFASSRATPAELKQRLDLFDIHPTGPLWGAGECKAAEEVIALENEIARHYPFFCAGLEREGLQQERRSLRLQVNNLQSDWCDNDLQLAFTLERGAYATTVLRELLTDESMQQVNAGELA